MDYSEEMFAMADFHLCNADAADIACQTGRRSLSAYERQRRSRVFYGMVRLPDNKWHLTSTDGDPAMYGLIKERFEKETFSLSCKGCHFLKRKFFELIKEDPAEYLRKCQHSLREMLTRGVYAGEFYQKPRDVCLIAKEG